MNSPQAIEESIKEYNIKKSIKIRMEKYYTEQTTKNGLSNLKKIKDYLPTKLQPIHFRRNVAIAHLDLEPIIEKIAKGQEFVVVSGLNPSSALHLGHKALFDLLLSLQKLGGRVFIPLTNDESLVDGKVDSLAKSRKIARESILPDVVSFGFDVKKTHIYVDSEYPQLYNFAMHLSQFVTFGQLKQVFGKESLLNPGQIFYRGVVQMAEILLPQLPEFGGPKVTLIPVGIDQHPYILLARDVAKKIGMIPPSELVIRFLPSLLGPEDKMSASKPNTAIYLDDTAENIRKKINKAYTGAVSALDVYQKLGGIPEICSVFSLINFHHPDDEYVKSIKLRYQKGQITMSELKDITAKFICELVEKHQLKRKNNKQNFDDFILKTPLDSFLKYE
ncbi:tryptophan--tRNA ligase [Candidatus Shapirobacteria bacterium CG_4_8_14_3_um_filter_35_11]|uniref:Tryptophan--tRNA ligase n=5 Tax=Candidatus Shapironibacteriota TaxID=1752721 RepID=A0A1J5HPP7_9BACT|nr:MAG: tryptophan--tRNA ligase [Candidatus Shapirobacteria bacterium CG2_30_35_20]PIX68304.1 MAG: tryptophan--tRNA ligase [Candidatus Shapirobacteria bacterium CG_4_10_14_3_um_filter_35_13]PJA51008.1 MAG: tryptophan--tRNA ligase [Candidatus Shapirobacteria bacterium CG_4_9_14_3_um_filter_36_12]PJC80649.1 MAG: tryptophan--tRNA ligase [Candidatus Shapirobacteria bacterium CG_4_8_14_3_um_filter_35_11]